MHLSDDKGHGGGKIKAKLMLTLIVILGITITINVSAASDATGNNSSTSLSQGATPVSPQVTYTPAQVNTAATTVKNYYDANNQLPNSVTIGNQQVTMAQFLELLTTDITQTNNGSTASIILKNVNNPSNPTQTVQSGTLTKSQYISLAQTAKDSIDSTGAVPNNVNSSLGQIRFESLVYIFSKTMNFYATNKRLPNTLSVTPWTGNTISEGTVTNPVNNPAGSQNSGTQATSPTSDQTFTSSQINTAATSVKNFYDSNGRLPSYVTVNNVQVTMAQFLQLLAYDLTQTNSGSTASITLKNVSAPSNPTETVKSGTLTKSEYVSLAQTVKNTIDSTGTAPNNVNSSLGQIKFETLIYLFSKTMNFYATNNRLPNTVSVSALTTTTLNSSSKAPANGYSAYNIIITPQKVTATAKCSCGRGTYTYQTRSFVNYCPQCHHYGTLTYSKPGAEGNWTCSYCDCDYCMQCGKEKMSGSSLWLTPA